MTDERDDGGQAFPMHQNAYPFRMPGMTLRDWFAGQALAGYMGAPEVPSTAGAIAFDCYDIADAMLAQRKEEKA